MRASPSWHLDRDRREVSAGGRCTRLAEKPYRVLVTLVDAAGRVVTRADLRRVLWADDTFVDFDNNLNSAVATLRHALGDSGRSPRFIETLPKVGYRLLAPPVEEARQDDRPADRSASDRRARRSTARGAGVVAMLVVAVALAAVVAVRDTGVDPPLEARPEALAEYHRGQFLRSQWVATHRDPDLLRDARAAFSRARSLDGALGAVALAEEADTIVELAFAGATPFRDALAEARSVADDALNRDGRQVSAIRVRGVTALFLDWNIHDADAWLRRAERLRPDDAQTALARATLLAARGRPREAMHAAQRAVSLDPASHFVRADLALFQLAAGQPSRAAVTSRQVLAVAPDFLPALVNVVLAHERLVDVEPAVPAARTLLRLTGAPDGLRALAEESRPEEVIRIWHDWDLRRMRAAAADRVDDYALALALRAAAAGDRESSFAYLERALARRDAMLVFIRAFPELATLRSDPRFESIASRVVRG